MQLNEIRYEQLKNDAMAASAFKMAGEKGGNITLDTSGDAAFQLSESRLGKGLLSSRDSFYGKKDLLDEALDNANNADIASQSDISMKNQMMAKAAKDLNEEAYSETRKEGFDLSAENPYELVTVADKIRINLAKGGVDISKMGDISEAAIEDHPEVKAALSKYSEIMDKGGITRESALFMVKNNLSPTIDNVYRASFGAAENAVSAESRKAAASLEETGQLAPVFEKAYLSPDDLGKDVISEFIENDIPVTPENMNAYTVLTKGIMKENGDEILAAVTDALEEGKAAGEAYVISGLSMNDAANDAARVIEKASDADAENVVRRGRTLSVLTLSAEFSYREDNDFRELSLRAEARARSSFAAGDQASLESLKSVRASANEGTALQTAVVSAKKSLAEAGLLMTSDSARSIMRHGLDIITNPLTNVLEALKAESESPLNSDSFERTNAAVSELSDTPVEFLGTYKSFSMMSLSLSTVRDDAVSFRLSYGRAGEAYETFGTKVRRDLGDSIKKAFSNVSDILSSLGMEDNEDNESAVRVLGYNSIEINKENIMSAKASLLEVRQTLNLLRPGTVASMIREGINPLEMSLSDLKETAQKINIDNNSPEESFGKFLYKAERTGELSEDELSAYKGIARLIYSVEKTDGAVIGQLLLEGADINLKNMLTGLRSRRHRGMDYTVDDDFGGVSAKDTGSLSISQQIEKAFQAGKMVESADYLSPAAFHAAASDTDYLSYTPEEFAERLKSADEGLSSKEGANDEALEKEYDKESLEEIKMAVSSGKEVYKALERLDIPSAPVYLSAMQGLMNDRNYMYRALFGKRPSKERNIFGETNEKAEGKDLSDVMEDLMRAFGEAVKTPKEMAEAQRKLADTAEHAMDDMVIEQEVSSVDVRGMKQISKQIQILSGMAQKRETYEMPILVADENGTMMLKIVRGEEEKGAVDLSMVFDNMGSITATLKYQGGHIKGAFESDSARTDAILRSAQEALNEAIERESGASSELSVSLKEKVNTNAIFTDSPSAGEEAGFGFLPTPPLSDDEGIETRRLYGIARAIVSVLSKAKDV